jgi:hypothetical protein
MMMWWFNVPRDEWAERVTKEAARMASDPKAKSVSVSPHQFADPPRRLRKPATYAAECQEQEALL